MLFFASGKQSFHSLRLFRSFVKDIISLIGGLKQHLLHVRMCWTLCGEIEIYYLLSVELKHFWCD